MLRKRYRMLLPCTVGDPDPNVFGPAGSGSGSISQRWAVAYPGGDAQDAHAFPPGHVHPPPSPAWKAGYEKRWGSGQQEKNANLLTQKHTDPYPQHWFMIYFIIFGQTAPLFPLEVHWVSSCHALILIRRILSMRLMNCEWRNLHFQQSLTTLKGHYHEKI